MSVSEYIATGILELYVLGELPASEMADVEAMAAEHPEVREELRRIQETQEELAIKTAITPRATLKDEILDKLAPQSNDTVASPTEASSQSAEKTRRLWPLQLGAAASLLLAVASILTAIYFRQQWKDAEQELDQVIAQNQEIAAQYETANQKLQRLSDDLSVATSPNYQLVALSGTDVSPSSSAQVYWNQESSQLYLNPSNLPAPPPGQQYQLWAIVDGQPVNAGVVNLSETDNNKLLAMLDGITQAAAFAITLEPEGGSESPTLEQMYVQGTVSAS